ncbi:MAG: hypothetical protein NVSMB9_06370 [Isosphaeraceae bacterium]
MATPPTTSDSDQCLPDEGLGGPELEIEDPSLTLLPELLEQEEGEEIDRKIGGPSLDFSLPGLNDRERALPVRQGDLTRLLLAQPGLSEDDRKKLEQFGKLLGATFHSEFFEKLRELKELYAPLDPDSDYVTLKDHSLPFSEDSDDAFLAPFEATLESANFRRLSPEIIEQAVSAPNEMGLTYTPDFSLFEHMRVYVRGYTQIHRNCRNARTRFRKRSVTLDAYQRMIVALKFKPGLKLGPLVDSSVIYLRMFKDVPHVDMEMHLPEQGTKVRMRWIDKAQIASHLMMGIPTMAVKLFAAYALSPIALGGLIIAPISAGVNSFFGFHRAKQKHLYAMIYKLYYLTLANNASVLTRLIDSAEDEEYKEAMLAYYFLWRGGAGEAGWQIPQLDDQIERFLLEETGIEIDFEVADAVRKLLRLGLAHSDPTGRLHAVSIDKALQELDLRWDNTFRYP